MSESVSSANDKIRKTRNRVPTSCEHCRKRKLKCDRNRPCGNCVRSQTEELCKYMSSPKGSPEDIPKINLNSEVIRLKLRINKLEKILQANNIDLSQYNQLPLDSSDDNTDSPSEESDPMVSLIKKFDTLVVKENKVLHSGTTSYVAFIAGDKDLSCVFEKFFKRHIMTYESYKKNQQIKASEMTNSAMDNHVSWLTSNVYNDVDFCEVQSTESMDPTNNNVSHEQAEIVLSVINDINKVLPPLYVVNTLVDHFFNYVYSFLPYVDESIFREEISYVLVPTKNGGCKVAITHVQNVSIISLLLLILRFAYLAVNVKDYAEDPKAIGNEFLIAMIKSNIKIGSNYVILAKSLLMALPSEDSIFRKITLRNIQTLLYLRLYQTYSPELNDESREHSLTLAFIIQMCRVLGANRDPEIFPYVFKDYREITLWRRIYYELLNLDVLNSYEYGTSLIISDDEWDVKLPVLKENDLKTLSDFKKGLSINTTGQQLKSLVVENSINKNIALTYDAIKLLREGMQTFQNFTESSKKSKLVNIVERIEEFLRKNIPNIYEMIYESNSAGLNQLYKIFDISKIPKFELRVNLLSFLNTFYYLLYLNEDDLGEEGNSKDKFQFGVRATEVAMIIFKIGFDYTQYMNQTIVLHGNSKQYISFKTFSRKLECFIVNRVNSAFQRAVLWIASIFLKNVKLNELSFEILLREFSNSVDATNVLKWFNVNVVLDNASESANDQFLFLLFQYIKDQYLQSHTLKNEYFVCWRTACMIKLFINFFKDNNDMVCENFLHPTVVSVETDSDCGRTNFENSLNNSTVGSTNISDIFSTPAPACDSTSAVSASIPLTNSKSENTDSYDTNFDNLMLDFETSPAALNDLLHDNFDAMIEEMFVGNSIMTDPSRRFDLFNFNKNDLAFNDSSGANVMGMDMDNGKGQADNNDSGIWNNDEKGAFDNTPSTGFSSNNGDTPDMGEYVSGVNFNKPINIHEFLDKHKNQNIFPS